MLYVYLTAHAIDIPFFGIIIFSLSIITLLNQIPKSLISYIMYVSGLCVENEINDAMKTCT